jgi:ribose-phosphate pyrophosphokinase
MHHDPLHHDPLHLFALHTSREFGEQVARHLGLSLSPHDERDFEDGEHKVRSLVTVRGRDVYVLASLDGEDGHSTNDKLCRMLFFIGALKDAAAARVTAVVPYLAYARKDTKTNPRDPVTLRYVAALFEAVGTDAILTLDVHNLSAFQNAFRCGTEHLDACALLASHFAPLVSGDVAVVSPDAGGAKRANHFRKCLSSAIGAPVGTAFCEKYRRGDTLSGELLVGDVAGKAVIVFDDLVSSGQTMARALHACRQHGATRVDLAASHGLFAPGAGALLAEAARIVVTDSVSPLRQQGMARLETVSCTSLFAQAIARMHDGGSVSELVAW